MGHSDHSKARRATQSTQKSCLFSVPPWWHQKIWMMSPKNWFLANKLHFWPKNQLFLRYTHITPFFGLKRTQLDGTMSSPYPKATLDIFGFPVGAHSVAGRDVLWPGLPKITLFGAKKCYLSRRDSCNDDDHGNGDDDDDLLGITLFSLFPNTKSHMCTWKRISLHPKLWRFPIW